MQGKIAVAAVASAPSFGPAIVTLFGTDIPVLAMSLSLAGLLLARFIGPPSSRKLTRFQEIVVTLILMLVLFLIVTGELPPDGKPLSVGMAVSWGVGLGLSGLLALEFLGERAMAALRAMFGMGGGDGKDGS